MRAGLVEAVHYARHRRVFGSLLIEEPLMLRVLADLALDSLAATALVMRLALAYDAGAKDPHEAAFARIMTPAAKYWITKTAPAFLQEAMECVGGNGCIEEGLLPRLYRDAPLHALWGGGGNLLCLEIARMVSSDPAALNAALTEIARDVDVDGPISVVDIRSAAAAAVSDPGTSRILTEQLALAGRRRRSTSSRRGCSPMPSWRAGSPEAGARPTASPRAGSTPPRSSTSPSSNRAERPDAAGQAKGAKPEAGGRLRLPAFTRADRLRLSIAYPRSVATASHSSSKWSMVRSGPKVATGSSV